MVIGITGGIGTGKSTVLQILKDRYDFVILETDKIAKDLMQKGLPVYEQVVDYFGRGIIDAAGQIDSRLLASIVFNDPQKLQNLNAIVHPAVIEYLKSEIQKEQGQGKDVVIESALLIESGCYRMCDTVWYVRADDAVRIERLKKGRKMTEEKIREVIDNQMTDDKILPFADAVLDNSRSLKNTALQIQKLLEF